VAYQITKDIIVANATDYASFFYTLKEALKARGWVVTSSGDGTSYSAAGDLITSGGVLLNTRAWFAIRNPDSTLFWVFQSNGTIIQTRVKVSFSAFSAGAPNATTTPAAAVTTDEFTAVGGGTDAAPSYLASLPSGTTRIVIGVDDAAPYGFFAIGWVSGGGAERFRMFCDPVAAGSYPSADPYRFVFCGPSNPTYLTSDDVWSNYNATYSPVAVFNNAGTRRWQRCGGLRYYEGAGSVIAGQAASSAVGSNVEGEDSTLPVFWQRRSALGGGAGLKGASSIFRLCCTPRASGDTHTETTSRDRLVIPPVTVPWDGSIPTV
jgi:hypothetical protein